MHTALLLTLVAATSYGTSVALRPHPRRERLVRLAPQVAVLATLAFVTAQAAGLGAVGAIVIAAAMTGADVHVVKLAALLTEQAPAQPSAPRARRMPATHAHTR